MTDAANQLQLQKPRQPASQAELRLRELIKHCPVMHRALLVNDLEGGLSDSFEQLHAHLSNAQFEIASDAFDTFQTLLTCDKATVKARGFEDWKDAVPRGVGNMLGRNS